MQLYTQDDRYKRPIAGFHKHLLDKTEAQSTSGPQSKGPATLRLAPRADEIGELVVWSFIFLGGIKWEKKMGFGRLRARVGGGAFGLADCCQRPPPLGMT